MRLSLWFRIHGYLLERTPGFLPSLDQLHEARQGEIALFGGPYDQLSKARTRGTARRWLKDGEDEFFPAVIQPEDLQVLELGQRKAIRVIMLGEL